MIGDQYAVARRVSTRRQENLVERIVLPIAAGPQRLISSIGRSDLVHLMLAMSLFAVALLLYLMQAGKVSVIQLNISEFQAQQTQLNAQVAALQAQQANLTAMSRVQSIALNQLHMGPPASSNTVWVQSYLPPVHIARPSGNINSAVRASSPLTQIENFISFVRASL